jgi:oligopeptide transport system ATP-binding protein
MTLLAVENLDVCYRVLSAGRVRPVMAVNQVSFTIEPGQTLGIIGESGSGKTTIARTLLRLIASRSGSIRFRGTDLLQLRGSRLRAMRRHLQMIFQDPMASLDPRMQVADIVAEPLRVFEPTLSADERAARVLRALQSVGLDAEHLYRFPHAFSGGQAQRIAIARALIAGPELIVCDEPLSALDVSIKSQISNLLKDLQQRMALSLLFISHDLAAVRFLCDRVLVLYLGRVMEVSDTASLFESPRHPYTRALIGSALAADPVIARGLRDEGLGSFAGFGSEIPSPLDAPSGCVFRTRCPFAIQRCAQETPVLRPVSGAMVACHRAGESVSS